MQEPLRNLKELRAVLIDLKQDRTTYIKSQDVLEAYDKLCAVLHMIDDTKVDVSSNLDYGRVQEDCFELISLLFLTIGRNNEPPAMYFRGNYLIYRKRLLDHLGESGNYSSKDLVPINLRLKKLGSIIKSNSSSWDPLYIAKLDAKLLECINSLATLQDELNRISPGLQSLHAKLVSLRRCIKAAEAKQKFSIPEVKANIEEIKKLEATKINGKFVADDGTFPDEGQEQVQMLVKRCYSMGEEAMKRQGEIAPSLKSLSDKLFKINSKLERLELTQAWSLRETDLYEIQAELVEIDVNRLDGKFIGIDQSSPEEGQSILLYLLRRSYAHIYTLMGSSEPVSEALTPIYNQLQTVQRCLKEVQKFGIHDARELYPYSMKLASIDDMKIDGKFMVGNDVPDGQARVAALLAECFEICRDLRNNEC
ncbi:hypothetical protein EDC01DRAFT_618485 [Geopyxis carbonaria]|nr:hypothetical protein EDC01DRAFT_618485 [Geopyxis carbonaria]